MAITNYSQLQAAIGTWRARGDLTAYTADFVALAETSINYGSDNTPALRCREMQTEVDITAGTDSKFDLPTDFLSPMFARLGNCNLEYLAPQSFKMQSTAGMPQYFTIIGDHIEVEGSTSNDLTLFYYAKVPALSVASDTNWLLTKHPNIYLKLALMEAALFVKDDEEALKQGTLASRLMSGLNDSDELALYANATMAIEGSV